MKTDMNGTKIPADTTVLSTASMALYELRCLGRTYVGTIEMNDKRIRVYIDYKGMQLAQTRSGFVPIF